MSLTTQVALTGERDVLLNQLDVTKMELRRELAARHDLEVLGGVAVKRDNVSMHRRRRWVGSG